MIPRAAAFAYVPKIIPAARGEVLAQVIMDEAVAAAHPAQNHQAGGVAAIDSML